MPGRATHQAAAEFQARSGSTTSLSSCGVVRCVSVAVGVFEMGDIPPVNCETAGAHNTEFLSLAINSPAPLRSFWGAPLLSCMPVTGSNERGAGAVQVHLRRRRCGLCIGCSASITLESYTPCYFRKFGTGGRASCTVHSEYQTRFSALYDQISILMGWCRAGGICVFFREWPNQSTSTISL